MLSPRSKRLARPGTSPSGSAPSSSTKASEAAKAAKKQTPISSPKKESAKKDAPPRKNVVDMEWEVRRQRVKRILSTTTFDLSIGTVIICNSVLIGVEQSRSLAGEDTTDIDVLESIFLTIYIVELGLRFFARGMECFKDKWIKLDAGLVALGILNTWILEPSSFNSDELGPVMILRMTRLMRLVKTARLLSRIQEFWMLARGILNSATVVVYTLAVLIVVLYIFSSIGIELITKHHLNIGPHADPAFQKQVHEFFNSIPVTMLTLMRFVAMDDLHAIYTILCVKDPWLSLYFVCLILVVSVVIMNLVTAVIFNSTMEANQKEQEEAKREKEMQWADEIRKVKDMFNRLDKDRSGQLSLDEFIHVDAEDAKILCTALDVQTPQEVFTKLDKERCGQVSINEFFDCILDRVLTTEAANLKRMERQIEAIQNDVQAILKSVGLESRTHPVPDGINKNNTRHAEPEISSARPQMMTSHTSVLMQEVLRDLNARERDVAVKLDAMLNDGIRSAFEDLKKVVGSSRNGSPRGTLSPPRSPPTSSRLAEKGPKKNIAGQRKAGGPNGSGGSEGRSVSPKPPPPSTHVAPSSQLGSGASLRSDVSPSSSPRTDDLRKAPTVPPAMRIPPPRVPLEKLELKSSPA